MAMWRNIWQPSERGLFRAVFPGNFCTPCVGQSLVPDSGKVLQTFRICGLGFSMRTVDCFLGGYSAGFWLSAFGHTALCWDIGIMHMWWA